MNRNHSHVHQPELDGTLSAGDFPNESVHLEFEDGSSAVFRYAFLREESGYTVVYTEHCGYFAFPRAVVSARVVPF